MMYGIQIVMQHRWFHSQPSCDTIVASNGYDWSVYIVGLVGPGWLFSSNLILDDQNVSKSVCFDLGADMIVIHC